MKEINLENIFEENGIKERKKERYIYPHKNKEYV